MAVISLLSLISCSADFENTVFARTSNLPDNSDSSDQKEFEDSVFFHKRLLDKAKELKIYLEANKKYNQQIAVLVDMKMNSGKKRLFIVDLDSMQILSKGLVAHGSGSNTEYRDSLTFSNIPESYQTSLGKYKIGAAYQGTFGRSYKLHGLEKTNSKALERYIVLHRYSCVPDEEQDYEICNSLGCIMLSENYFEQIDPYIKSSAKPILLEVYY